MARARLNTRNVNTTPKDMADFDYSVLILTAAGLNMDEIMQELSVGSSAVQHSRTRILRKYDARNAAHAIANAYHRGDLRVPQKEGHHES